LEKKQISENLAILAGEFP